MKGMIRKYEKEQIYSFLLKATLIFILLQPIFDVLSFLYIRSILPIPVSTYIKPLLAGLINIALLFTYKRHFVRCGIVYGAYLVLTIVHTLLLKGFFVEFSVIAHELRFMINLLYLLICYFNLRILYTESYDKKSFAGRLSKVLMLTFALYFVLYLLAVLTGTSGMTYEYSDSLKEGYKGWMDSGQIFGHLLCVCFPFILAKLLNCKMEKKSHRVLCKIAIVVPSVILCMIGTKVSYYIAIIVLVFQALIEAFFALKEKQRIHWINGLLCVVCAAGCILVYPLTPVKTNTDINNAVLSAVPDQESLDKLMEEEQEKYGVDLDHGGNSEAEKNARWTRRALNIMAKKYEDGTLHPSDMRNRQLVFNFQKFKLAEWEYKLFGIGYLNQRDMAIERDVLCVLFGFGIAGFILLLLRPICLWFKSLVWILRKLLKADVQTFCLFEGFSMFFFISFYAGATFIYTNFALFLSVLMCLLNHKIETLKDDLSKPMI